MANKALIDLYQKWSAEENLVFDRKWGEDLQKNGPMFSVHRDKLLTLEMFHHFNIPHVDFRRLSTLNDALLHHACIGRTILRTRIESPTNLIYSCKDDDDIRHAFDDLQFRMEEVISYPSYRDQIKFRLYVIDGQIEMVSRKEDETVVTDEPFLQKLQALTDQISPIFQLGYAAIDVLLVNGEKLKVVELMKPDMLVFGTKDLSSELLAKNVFLKALRSKLSR